MGHYCTWVFVLIRGVTFGEGSLISGGTWVFVLIRGVTFGEGSALTVLYLGICLDKSGALLYLGICLDKRGDLW